MARGNVYECRVCGSEFEGHSAADAAEAHDLMLNGAHQPVFGVVPLELTTEQATALALLLTDAAGPTGPLADLHQALLTQGFE